LLDQETCNLITVHALFKPDAGGSQSQVTTHEGVIAWTLPASTSPLAAPRPVSSAAAPEKVICKKSLRTGSLADYERTCMTQREWATQSDETKLLWDDIQGRKGSSHGD
jgi:hypothetical protein